MRAAVILNTKAGSVPGSGKDFKKEITEYFGTHGIKADFIDRDLNDVNELLDSGYDFIAASGGDGTISNIAGLLSGTSLPLGIIPSGTLNHFAKDNSIPLEPMEAVKVIAEYKIKRIDTAEVNGRVFINNSSIGLYPKMVKQRERLGGNKWISMFKAFIRIFGSMPHLDLSIKQEAKHIHCRTPFVFIGNNEYKMDLFNLGTRDDLTKGMLSVFYPKETGHFAMLRFALLALLNKLEQHKNFEVILTDEITIHSNKEVLEVALDGEVHHMRPPLKYKIRHLDLKLIVPDDK